MMQTTFRFCDVCGDQKKPAEIRMKHEMQFMRHFDDTDGRTFKKHLVIEKIDICVECLNKTIQSGKFLLDNRVQGHGTIELRGDDSE